MTVGTVLKRCAVPTRRRFITLGGGLGAALAAQTAPLRAAGVTEPFAPDVGDLFTKRALQASLDRLATQKDLKSGGAGDIGTALWLEKELRSTGYAVSRQTFNVPYFNRRLCSVSWEYGELALLPQAVVTPTGADGLSGELVLQDLTNASEPLAGKIALIVLPYGRHSSLESLYIRTRIEKAHSAGAAAIILVTTGPSGEAIALNVETNNPLTNIPIAIAAPKTSEGLISAARQGMPARLTIDGNGGQREAYNLIGQRPGTGKTVIVSTPRSGWGAVMGERGPGIATWVALSKALPQRFPKTNLIFLSTSGHEYENLGGRVFLHRAAPPPEEVALWVHLGAGFAARDWHEAGDQLLPLATADPQRYLVASDSLVPSLRQRFKGLSGLEMAYPASIGAQGELKEILAAGYETTFGMFGAHRFHHVANDGPNMTNAALVRPVARAVLGAIEDALLN